MSDRESQNKGVSATLPELQESVAFERWALSGLVPPGSSRPYIGTKDLVGSGGVAVRIGQAIEVNVAAPASKKITIDLRPLAFGLAWKVLDLVLEFAFEAEGRTPFRSDRWVINEKTRLARLGAGSFPPPSNDVAVWERLLSVYANTEEVRHSLVHRKAEVDKASGELVGTDRSGNPLAPISTTEQEAFCRAVQRAADAGLSNRMTSRELEDLKWNLDQLAPIHGETSLNGVQMQRAALIYAPITLLDDGRVELDMSHILASAEDSWPTLGLFDVEIELPDGRIFRGELEHAPSGVVRFLPDDPPTWLNLSTEIDG